MTLILSGQPLQAYKQALVKRVPANWTTNYSNPYGDNLCSFFNEVFQQLMRKPKIVEVCVAHFPKEEFPRDDSITVVERTKSRT